ncbi:uncharacterized protein LOC113372337 isoform X2 [Ctenocephalides felis]|nr:uncharacterized protein LOC113372337 isoform X2 [Ctenocephalides felis]
MSFYDAGETISTAIQAPLFHTAAFLLFVPLARSAAPRWGAHVRTVPLLGVALLCAGLGLSALLSVSRSAAYIACYGLLGGAGASVVVAHVDFTINRLFAGYPGLVQGLCHAGQAAGQFAMPHLTLAALQRCGQRGTHAVLTGIMMNMVAAILLMTLKDNKQEQTQINVKSDSEPENTSFPAISNAFSPEEQLTERCWRCPSDGANSQPLSPPLIRRSSCGFDILQSIPEESEASDSDDYDDLNATTIIPLQNGHIGAGENVQSIKHHATILDLSVLSSAKTDITIKKILPRVRFPKAVQVKSSLDVFRKVELYPCILLSTCELLLPLLHSTLTPLYARTVLNDLTDSEAVFLMSLASFSWLCLVFGAPWLAACRPMRMRFLFAIGIFLKTIGLTGVMFAKTHDVMTLSSVIFGIGNGGTTATTRPLIRLCIGDYNFNKFEGAIDTMSGLLIIGFGIFISIFLQDKALIKKCFSVLCAAEIVSMIFVVILPCLVKECAKCCHANKNQCV